MSHEIAKLMLEHAQTFLDRQEAIRSAMALGMPLNEIEEYLDWLDQTKDLRTAPTQVTPHSKKNKQGTGNGERGTGNGERGAGNDGGVEC